ncbi:MAG: Holliday junction resolvase RuvX [Gammaproteobacteria bacterium]
MPDRKIQTVIGFDLGTGWTGVAVGQTLTTQARPLAAIKSIRQKPDWPAITRLLREWKPQKLIVGLPHSDYDDIQVMGDSATRFSRQLQGRYLIETELIDEGLTTREAFNLTVESGQRKSKPEIDSLAAVLITESWLREYQRHQSILQSPEPSLEKKSSQ